MPPFYLVCLLPGWAFRPDEMLFSAHVVACDLLYSNVQWRSSVLPLDLTMAGNPWPASLSGHWQTYCVSVLRGSTTSASRSFAASCCQVPMQKEQEKRTSKAWPSHRATWPSHRAIMTSWVAPICAVRRPWFVPLGSACPPWEASVSSDLIT